MNLNYNLTSKDAKELVKLYPKIRIPFFEHADYYLGLQDGKKSVTKLVEELFACKNAANDEIGHYKMKKLDEILEHFKSRRLDVFNSHDLTKFDSNYPKSFSDFRPGKIYMSVDMKEACWTVFKKYANIQQTLDWSSYAQKEFRLDKFVASSKSFRQLVFGNLNPSRQQHFQKRYMVKMADMYNDYLYEEQRYANCKLVMVSSDEILFEFDSIDDYVKKEDAYIDMLNLEKTPLKISAYTMNHVDNLGDRISIKKPLDSLDRLSWELYSINGSRFFMHYKTLILQQTLDDRDLLFEPEPNKLAKWII